jgi:hypothetical protein
MPTFPVPFSSSSRLLLLGLALAAPALQAQQTSASQAGEAQCVLAGRLNSDGRWAPQAAGMQLLDAGGKLVASSGKSALSSVNAVRLAKPALLTKCNAGQAMADGDASTGSKSPTPALTAGSAPIEVQAMATLPGRAGGQWVELRVSVPAERVVMLSR